MIEKLISISENFIDDIKGILFTTIMMLIIAIIFSGVFSIIYAIFLK